MKKKKKHYVQEKFGGKCGDRNIAGTNNFYNKIIFNLFSRASHSKLPSVIKRDKKMNKFNN